MNNNILSLLGLALRGGRLAVGEEPAALAAKSGQARLLLAASDAAGNTLRRAEHLAQQGQCLWLVLPFSKAELGGALGRGSAAIAALTDLGLAAAVTERLAQLDPERYAGAAARMELKRRRAKERQSAPRRDRPKKAPPPRGGPGSRPGRPHAPKDGQRPGDRRPQSGRQPPSGSGGRRAGKPGRREDWRSHGGSPGRPQGGRPEKDRPFKNRGGPRSGGGQGRGGGR